MKYTARNLRTGETMDVTSNCGRTAVRLAAYYAGGGEHLERYLPFRTYRTWNCGDWAVRDGGE